MTVLTSSQLLVTVKEELTVGPPRSSVNTFFIVQWKTILAEFKDTAFLLFFGCMTCIPLNGNHSQPLQSSFGFGIIIVLNIQTFGHISEAHMNPCITLIAVLWKRMSLKLGIFYVLAQCTGAFAGYGLLIGVSPIDLKVTRTCVTTMHDKNTTLQALSIELLSTIALSFLTCATWDTSNKESQVCSFLKFGFTIAGLSLAGGQLTGASMNPARSLGPALWTGGWEAHWIYWLGPLLGSIKALALTALSYKRIWLKMES